MKVKLTHCCKTLHEFDKICRKYVFPSLKCRFKNGKHIPGSTVSKYDLYDWNIYYQAGRKELESPEFIKYAKKCSNLESIRQDAIKALDEHMESEFARFVGIEITQEDYYWAYVDKETNKCFVSTCVGSIEDGFYWHGRTKREV